MKAPIYLYYQLENFYQNHRLYFESKYDDQLRGEVKKASNADDVSDVSSACEKAVYNKEIPGATHSYTGVPLDPEEIADPCGLIAQSYFTDEFVIEDSDGNELNIN